MALAKPQKSKGTSPTQPVGGYQSTSTTIDSCCIPESVPANVAWTGKDSSGGMPATAHIQTPTAH